MKTKLFSLKTLLITLFFCLAGLFFHVRAADIDTSLDISNVAPGITAAQDDSDGTSPTNVDSDTAWTFSLHDNNADDLYVIICSTNEFTAGTAGSKPTCIGAEWAAVTNGSPLSTDGNGDVTGSSLTRTALSGDSESNAWYLIVCDDNPAGRLCNTTSGVTGANSQGSGNNDSPFKVNHRPVIGTVYMGASYGSNNSVDPGSDASGKVTTPIGNDDDNAIFSAIQPDGKVVVSGSSHNGSDLDFALVRYNADGTLDTSFDSDGKVVTPVGTGEDTGYKVAIQDDGKIVLAGRSHNGSNNDFAVVRYNTDGSLDDTFDGDSSGNGIVTTDINEDNDEPVAIAIQDDGKIVLAGLSYNGSNNDFAVVRYNSNGTLDTGFDTDGKVITPIGSGADTAYGVAIQDDGKIVVVGYSYDGSWYEIVLVRYNTDGSLDDTFDGDSSGNGIVTTNVGSRDDHAYDIKIQDDGKLVVAGDSHDGSKYDFIVLRYDTDGTLDTTFGGGDGYTTSTFAGGSNDYAMSLALQSDGKILLGGYSNSSGINFAATRYSTTGSIDGTFGSSGYVNIDISGNNDYGRSISLLNDGKITLAGNTDTGSDTDFALVRLESDGTLDDLTDYICVQVAVTDSDTDTTKDTVDAHICSSNSFTNNTCDDTTLCIAEDVESGYNAQCAAEDQVPIPTAHGSYNAYVFLADSHGFTDGGSGGSDTYDVTDTDPYLGTYSTSNITVSAGSSAAANFSVAVYDDNGDNDITDVSGVLFDKDTVDLDADGMITGLTDYSEGGKRFGEAVATGDFNNNGQQDLVVTAWQGGHTYNYVYIFLDGSLPATPSGADVVFMDSNSDSSLGRAKPAIGDFNDDTKTDIAISALGADRVYIFYGNNDGTFGTGSCDTDCTTADADETIDGTSGERFGSSLAAGDFDNDTKTDLAAGAWSYDEGGLDNRGCVYIFYNDGEYPSSNADADEIILGEAANSWFGYLESMLAADLNNDNKDDLVVGAPVYNSYNGRAYIFYNDGEYPSSAGSADAIITGTNTGQFGYSPQAGDLNNDNKTDLIISDPFYDPGAVKIFYQDATTWGTVSCTTDCSADNADVTIEGESKFFGVGTAVGDLNNDSKDDLATANFRNSYNTSVYIFYQDGVFPSSAADADAEIEGENDGDAFGYSNAVADLNNDSKDDLIVGGRYAYAGQGRVYVFYNDGTGEYPAHAGDGWCNEDENDCYVDTSCTISNQGSGTDNTLDAQCDFTVWFNANDTAGATEYWEAHANPSDGLRIGDESDSNNNITINALSALDISDASIAYGTVAIGGVSGEQSTTIENKGNQVIDVLIQGTDMTSGGNTIPRAKQEWSGTGSFSYGTGYDLVETASAGAESAGCSNRDLAVRDVHDTGTEDEILYWLLEIPSSQESGTYSGTNTFTTTSDSSCSGTY